MGSEENSPPRVMLIFVAGPLPDRGLQSITRASLQHIPCLCMFGKQTWALKYRKSAFDFFFFPQCPCILLSVSQMSPSPY